MLIDLFSPSHRSLAAPSLLILLLLLAGCGSEPGTDLGEWTLKTSDRLLNKDLEVSESKAFYFGRIFDLDVTSNGEMVVADWDANNIKVLRPDGTLIDTLGREGDGPGEFQRLQNVQAARNDSIYAYDPQRSRLTVFSPPPSSAVSRALTISREKGFAVRVRILGDRLLGTFVTGTRSEKGIRRPPPQPWRWIDASGNPGDTLMVARQRKRALVPMEGNALRIRPIPYGRETQIAIGPQSRLYHGWTDSLRIAAHGPRGTSEMVASIPPQPIPVQDADRDSALTDLDSDVKEMVSSALPNTKPAFTDLVVADDGRLWVQRPAEAPSAETVAWWILAPDNKTIRETHLPESVDLEVVQDGNAYGTTTTDAGAPAVVRYNVSTDT